MEAWRERAVRLGQKRVADKRAQESVPFWDIPLPERGEFIPLPEREEFKRGRCGEHLVARWLTEHGWYVIPSYDYSGENGDKAPRLQGAKDEHSVPDFDAARDGLRRWVEVKTKARANYRRTTGTFEHGIDYRLLEDYRKVERITGTECWIAIFEESSGQLLIQSLRGLGEPRVGREYGDYGKQIANWNRDKFQLLHTFTEAERAMA